MLRIGITGTENSHVDHFIRHLNVEQRHDGCRVVALAGGDTERNRTLAATGEISDVVDSAAELVGRVDALIVSNRDGRQHRENAVPLLEAGAHVFVDKPIAVSVADTEAIIAAARKGGGVLASWSPLRLTADVEEVRTEAAKLGAPQLISVVGPANPDDPHAGLFFYGPHVVEPALEILGNSDPGEVHVEQGDDVVTATVRAGDAFVALTFIRPADAKRVPWHITVASRNGVMSREIQLDADYNARGLSRFIEAARTGTPPMPYEHLLPPVRILAAITEQLR
ncbi:Gfo/Idh/MocA family protein [Phytoactinopolyspora limicola]|uniref:Gfo/Idh/MocA family protein n=1 Tax=Phytoactinopolyspora limicola TaxID=2715536 RepID=UPI00140B0DCC|nr:Gfo/Idh/MocA family oxidoreductase [Phytoactinopolyspora limicola]